MRIDIMTLFPETVNAVLHESIIGRAAKKGIVEINCLQIRDFTENKQMQVDDYPYGGGWGCVMMAQPLKSCLDSIRAQTAGMRTRVIYMSPQGKTYTQQTAKRLKQDYDHLVLVCGHYEGIDERFIEDCVDEEISLGDFVLTGGEIAAMAVADSVCRLVPGVLSDEQCYTGESHWDGLLEYPQYTRPEVWEGRAVPEVLLQGNHERVERWRRKEQLRRTRDKRPDMFEKLQLADDTDRQLLAELQKEAGRMKLTQAPVCRTAAEEDLAFVQEILHAAAKRLKKYRTDEPGIQAAETEELQGEQERGTLQLLLHGEEMAGAFTLAGETVAAYDTIADGRWSDELPYCVLSRAVLAPQYRGSGAAAHLLRCAEELTRAMGRNRLRTDVNRKNKPMQALLRENGYRYRGNITVQTADGREQTRQAFEKILKDKKS